MKKILFFLILIPNIVISQETINIGSSPNDGTGDKLRDALIKLNNNTIYFDDFLNNLNNNKADQNALEDSSANLRAYIDSVGGNSQLDTTILSTSNFNLYNDADPTKKIAFSNTGQSTGTTSTITVNGDADLTKIPTYGTTYQIAYVNATNNGLSFTPNFIYSSGLKIARSEGIDFSLGSSNNWVLYQLDANKLQFKFSGATKFQLISGSPSYMTTGTNSVGYPAMYDRVATSTSPPWSFVDDDNTGFGRAAADKLSLIAGGLEGLRIDSDTAKTDFIKSKDSSYITTSSPLRYSGVTISDDNDLANKGYVDDKYIFTTKTFASPLNIDFSTSVNQRCVITGTTTVNVSNIPQGTSILILKQNATGYAITVGTGLGTLRGTGTLKTTANAINVIQFIYDGTDTLYSILP